MPLTKTACEGGLSQRILVTGGAGFLGSHLCEALLGEGYDVVCLDNFSTGSQQAIARLLKNPFFELITHDITEPCCLREKTCRYGKKQGGRLHQCPGNRKGNRRQFNIRIKVARIFNTYGPYMKADDARVIRNFIVQALKQEPLTVYGDGTQTRSLCYISDMIKALKILMNKDDCFAGPVNLGDPCEKTIGEIAETIISLPRSSSRIVFLPLPESDPQRRLPDITLAIDALRCEPTVSLVDGLEETIRYFKWVLNG